VSDLRLSGIGMTSARTRDRLVQRLREQGVANLAVLDRIRNVPRIFLWMRRSAAAPTRTRIADRIWSDHFAALHRGAHDGGAARVGANETCWSRHGVRLSDGGACAAGRALADHRAYRALLARASAPEGTGIRNVRFRMVTHARLEGARAV